MYRSMDLTEAEALARRLMADHDLPGGWTFAFDSATRRMGLCSYQHRRISISRHFTAHATEAEVRDVVLHEIAHVLAGYAAKHGPQWKAVARRLGATPKACGHNPYAMSDEAVQKRMSKVKSEQVYLVIGAKYRGRRFRLLGDNTKSYLLVDEEGRTLRAHKGLVYREGEPEPTREDARQQERQRNIEAAKGLPVVRVGHPKFAGQRFAILPGRTTAKNHLLVNIDTGDLLRAPWREVRPETASERLGAKLLAPIGAQ